ncbi:hypothetical protein [Chryseobacterium sp. T1]
MKKTIFFLLLFFCVINLKSQENVHQIKKEALQNIKKIKNEYKNGNLNESKISELFCKEIYCFICNEKYYDDEFGIDKSKINHDILKEITDFINLKKLKKSGVSINKENEEYLLGYSLMEANPKTGFEGSGLLISFKKEGGKLKFHGIQTIP